MSEVLLTEQLDQAVSNLLREAEATPPSLDPEIAALLDIAAGLRALPRRDFKARLRNELEGRTSMTGNTAVKSAAKPAAKIREGFRAVTPYLTVPDVFAEIEFITATFGAAGEVYGLGSAGGYHSEYKVGDSMIMIGGGGGKSKWKGEPAPASLHVYVEDVDDVYRRALQAGAKSLMPPTDMDYGERSGAIEDPGGNHWYLATAFGSGYVPEGRLDVMAHFSLRGARKMIDFLESAFAAETLAVHESPDGVVHHAVVSIVDSIVEVGEAHGLWQPRPMHFMLYVDDADAWYSRAMNAEGAISMGEPSDQPYGARVGTIKDPFENVWYIATRL
ncbi:MAG: VOC family protein [Acidobacteriota bacterium]